MLFSFFATATHEAVNDEDLYPLQKPSLLAKIKFDLFSVKPDSVFIIFYQLKLFLLILSNSQFFYHFLYVLDHTS